MAEQQGIAVAQQIAARLGAGPAVEYRAIGVCFVDDGQGRAAPMEVDLTAPGGPKALLKAATKAGFEGKVSFERERLEKWFRD